MNRGSSLSRLLVALVLVLHCKPSAHEQSGAVVAQKADTGRSGKGPTKMEALASRSGFVVVLGFSSIGTVNGMYGTSVEVQARETRLPQTDTVAYGAWVRVTEAGSYEKKSASYVDYDEIDPLLRGIDFITRADRSVTRLGSFQAEYRTQGDLTVSTFSSSSGEVLAGITSGEISSAQAFFPLSQLNLVRGLLARAKEVLDSIRPAQVSP